MRRVSQALEEILRGNPFLEFGVHHGLFNLTQLAGYLQPFVEARTNKQVRVSAITMNLSRVQRALRAAVPAPDQFVIESLTVHSRLCTVTYRKSPEVQRKLMGLYRRVEQQNGFWSLSQGLHETTVIVDGRSRAVLDRQIRERPIYANDRLSAVGVQFGERYADIPGMLYMLLQRVALQNINLIEITSTYTEIIFFVDEADTQMVFDVLFGSFVPKATSLNRKAGRS